jgi:nicotinamidase-related amidase
VGTKPKPVPALLVVDMQNELLDGDNAVPRAAEVMEQTAALLRAARAAGALVVHIQNDGTPGSPYEPGTHAWEIHPSVAPLPNERVVNKTVDDGFDGTDLEQLLAADGVSRVAVAGVQSEMCVSATIRGAFARKLEVVLATDAHATYDVDDIPSTIVSRVAEHALGDEVELAPSEAITFLAPG